MLVLGCGQEGAYESLVIGNIGEHSLLNIIAKEKGYFQENGLDAQIREYQSGPPAVNDLLNNQLDVAIAANFVGVTYIFANENLRILAITSEHDIFKFVGRKSKGINSPSDLHGKTIGVTRKGAGEFFLGVFLTFNNLSTDDIKLVDLTPSEISAKLQAGEIDGAVIFDPHVFRLQELLGDDIVVWPVQSDQKVFALSYTTERLTRDRPAALEKYLESLIDAEEFIRENPDEAKRILAEYMGYEDSYVEHLWPNFDFSIGLSQELILSMEDQSRWSIDNQITNQTVVTNYFDYIYFDALENVKPNSVEVTR